MTELNLKKITEELIDTFLYAGEISLELREKGLIKEIKSDNTPVSNGDLEVNKIITNKIKNITPKIPIVSEETSDNKSIKNLKDFRKSRIVPIASCFLLFSSLHKIREKNIEGPLEEKA